MKDTIVGVIIGAVAFWYAKCPIPRAYRWITDKTL